MKQCYFIPLILINVCHILPLSPIKIWNPWNLRFQVFMTENHDILETEKTSLSPMQQFFVKISRTNHGWSLCSILLLIENLLHQANCFSAVLLYLKSLFRMSPKFTISADFMSLEHHRIHSYFYIYIFKYQKRFEFWLCHNILCLRQSYLTFLNFSLFIGKVVIVLFALLAHWEIEM